uniref:ATP synthase subunit a n=1 Tax=Acanthaphritis unoorum TaxID=270607 RepID=A0A1V1FW84_9TELE|nr:ATP synthase F0 subunit 6 [Acanthaphritis unoorum]BAX03895.1 ATPase subunit 6 [Acanthaphritis unoorum]BBU26077.1 ATPase subunit 6 [Acanthaphritis unoorum]
MAMSYFSQFASPYFLGIPLFALAVILPWLLFPHPPNNWSSNRAFAIQALAIKNTTKVLVVSLDKPAHKWALMIIALFTYLITMNTLGLLPYTFTPTTQLSLNLGLAFPLWLTTVIIGFFYHTNRSLAHMAPQGTPPYLVPAVILIETISLFIRPISLAVRLTANLTAGHLLIQLLATAALKMAMKMSCLGITMSILAGMSMAPLILLEIAVAAIQAYVFVLLFALYLQENV